MLKIIPLTSDNPDILPAMIKYAITHLELLLLNMGKPNENNNWVVERFNALKDLLVDIEKSNDLHAKRKMMLSFNTLSKILHTALDQSASEKHLTKFLYVFDIEETAKPQVPASPEFDNLKDCQRNTSKLIEKLEAEGFYGTKTDLVAKLADKIIAEKLNKDALFKEIVFSAKILVAKSVSQQLGKITSGINMALGMSILSHAPLFKNINSDSERVVFEGVFYNDPQVVKEKVVQKLTEIKYVIEIMEKLILEESLLELKEVFNERITMLKTDLETLKAGDRINKSLYKFN